MTLTPQKALNKAYRRQSINKDSLEVFKSQLLILLDRVNRESEEHHKNDFVQFLNDTFYKGKYYINTKDKIDCVINAGAKKEDVVNVIIEHKSPANKSEMISTLDINKKALQESILYYMRERFDNDGKDNNTNLKQILITNNTDVFIFDAVIIENLFAKNKKFKKDYIEFEAGQKSGGDTGFFYNSICKPFIDTIKDKIEFTYVNLTDYRKLLDSNEDSSKIINLYKLFSPTHLLKLNFANDSNTLDKNFYNELLHIIGLEEVKDGGKKLIQKCKSPNYGSILENTIDQVRTEVRLSDVSNIKSFGDTRDEQIYNISLELVITWINRILFLKLLESQLISYNKSNNFKFVDLKNIADYDSLYLLFFKVLAVKTKDRRDDINEKYKQVPYLNSSLFEITELERQAIGINTLSNNLKLPLANSTVLKDNNGKRLSGEKEALSYLLEFLDAYNFSSEGTAQVQEDNKTLINASVLGLIYEKLNGYKDGSFFTPGYITMYMCHETIRRAVVQKFNDSIDDVTFDSFDDLTAYTRRYFKSNDITRFNKIVNSIRICDPAVGSGHFLVSALNELIAIKHELGILADKEFKPLPIDLEIENDELMITDRFDELFSYNPNSKDSQNIQETLFHEKQTLIENCLFGVDINPNSVKICRLRLWIELLKNTYYKENGELEVLPNIDINIKCGNSLISRFDIDTPISKALKKSKLKVQDYKDAVYGYKNAKSKEQKENLENLIAEIKGNFQSEVASNDKRLTTLKELRGELQTLETQDTMFERSKAEEKTYNKQKKDYVAGITKLEAELEEIKSNRIYDNAFEWRFEFPEVLADNGDFIGFDVVIGNPPYAVVEKERNTQLEPYQSILDYCKSSRKYDPVLGGKLNLYRLFISLSNYILSPKSKFGFIIPLTFIGDNSLNSTRQFVLDSFYSINLSCFPQKDIASKRVFEEAKQSTLILIGEKNDLMADNDTLIEVNTYPFNSFLDDHKCYVTTKSEIYRFDPLKFSIPTVNGIEWELLKKIHKNKSIRDITDIVVNRGEINQTLNRKYINQNKQDANLLKGVEIAQYLIKSKLSQGIKEYFNETEYINDNKYNKLKDHNRIATQRITGVDERLRIVASIAPKNSYFADSTNSIFILEESQINIMFLLALLNSKLFQWRFKKTSSNNNVSTTELESLPFHFNSETNFNISLIVEQILKAKKVDPEANTTELEQEIDLLVYKLYDLTEEEIKIVENG